jgi:CheY-like chemotaxis protein
VIWNLLDNAVKFSPAGGVVVVRLNRAGDTVQFSVSDRGRGISPEFLPHIFERFRQEDSSTRRAHGGLGLGLAIVKSLVEAHGGTVAAESAGLQQGTTFTVRVPAAGQARASDASAGEIAARSLDGLRVLVVEDDDDARALIRGVFEEARAVVVATHDVPSAIAQLDHFAPQLLVSDLGIPGEDGYDLIRQIRTSGHPASTLPAIALTAFGRDQDRADALRAGYQQHVMKPVEPHHILEIAWELTGNRQTS